MKYSSISFIPILLIVLSCNSVANAKPLERILFGSCGHQDKDMPILDSIIADDPDLFIFLGDNIYGDTEDMTVLADKYQKLGAKPRFKNLSETAEVIAIWDDHDYGENDAGAEYPKKQQSRQLMLDFWQEPADSVRRSQKDGIYTSYIFGDVEQDAEENDTKEPGNNKQEVKKQRVQVILPDLRWNRPAIQHVSTPGYLLKRKPRDMGPYSQHPDPNASMLGETQWQWLEEQLQQPAEIRIIGSSLQVLADFTGWEAWHNFPADIARLKRIIKKHKVNGVLLISGDTHWGEVSYVLDDMDYPLWEVTSSGLTEEWKNVSPNKNRIGQFTHDVNYGAIEIDWELSDPLIRFGLHDINGDIVTQHSVRLSSLSPY